MRSNCVFRERHFGKLCLGDMLINSCQEPNIIIELFEYQHGCKVRYLYSSGKFSALAYYNLKNLKELIDRTHRCIINSDLAGGEAHADSV